MTPKDSSQDKEVAPGPAGVDAAPSQAEMPDDQEELRRQIDQTRAELGDTVEALSAKADVKAQVKEKVDERKDQLHDQQERVKANPAPFAGAAGGLVALLLMIFLLRRRGS